MPPTTLFSSAILQITLKLLADYKLPMISLTSSISIRQQCTNWLKGKTLKSNSLSPYSQDQDSQLHANTNQHSITQSITHKHTNLGPQHVASEETLELLLGNAPCDSSSLIIPCTTCPGAIKTHSLKLHKKNRRRRKDKFDIPCENHATARNRKSARPCRNPERSRKGELELEQEII